MSGEPELIPCPFCGGDGQYFLAWLGTMGAWVPCCTECEAVIDVPFLSKEEAAAAWNRRDWRAEEPVKLCCFCLKEPRLPGDSACATCRSLIKEASNEQRAALSP